MAIGRQITGDDVADVRHQGRLGQVASPVDSGDMEIRLVGATNPVTHDRHLAISHHLDRLLHIDQSQIAGLAAEVLLNLLQRGKPEAALQTGNLVGLDLVHVVIAAQHQKPELSLDNITLPISFLGRQHQGFDRARQRNIQVLGHILASTLARGCRPGHHLRRRLARDLRQQGLRLFHVRCVVTGGAVHDGVFTSGSDHLELLAQVAPNGAAVRSHCAIAQSKPIKNPTVGLRHDLVTGFGGSLVTVKTVGILHDEFAPAHEAKSRAALITEFGLDLVEILG